MKYVRNSTSNGKWKRRLILGAGTLIFLLAAGWLAVSRWYQVSLEPLTQESNEKVIAIELGSSTAQVARQLEGESLIKNATAFTWYVSRLDDSQVIQAGTYKLDSNMSVPDIADILVSGRVDTSLVTVVSGLRLAEVQQVLVNAGFNSSRTAAALSRSYNHSVTRHMPDGATLEGYIYPQTYQITTDSTPETIIISALDELDKQLTSSLLNGIERQGLSLHEAIILASIVQKESRDYEDQRKVAQVFLKRLDMNMPLGADATFRYAAAVAGQEPSVDFDSPYNTRIHEGLPPGPIANFDISALNAVANPAGTDHLYFLHGDDCLEEGGTCTTYFADTQAEHEANAAKYCQENCRLDP